MLRRVLASALLTLGLAGGFVLATAAPAFAHAVLESTTPTPGSELHKAPTSVSLHFGEGVGIDNDSIEVSGPGGRRVDTGDAHHPAGEQSTVVADLKPRLRKASYTVTWHVVSADSHPVGGTFTFGYGVPAGTAPPTKSGPTDVRALHYIGRLAAFLGLVVLLGGAVFLIAIWPAGATTRRVHRLLAAGWLVVLAATSLLFLMEGPYGEGRGLGATFRGSTLSATVHERYGQLMLARIWLLVIAVPARRLLPAARRDERGVLAALGVGLLATYSLSEHSGQGLQVPLAATQDLLHLGSVSIWLGGLAMIATALARQPAATARGIALRRWSTLATTAVLVLVGSGAYLTWRNVGTLPALWSTDYGRLLLIKWWGLILLLVLGNLGRLWVRRWAAPGARPSDVTAQRLRASVGLELMIGACVLAAAAALVNSVPARQSYTPAFTAHVKAEDAVGKLIDVRVHLSTTKAGPVAVTVDAAGDGGRAIPLGGATGNIEQADSEVEPVRFTLRGALRSGHGRADGVVVPGPGHWLVILQLVTSDGDDYAAQTQVTIKP